ncbi:hypothetical protein KBC79_05720 [Candidatus Woesebacteria bacterium]|nr:hypothetical protein [Candidatus Woesebacteria bacterium]
MPEDSLQIPREFMGKSNPVKLEQPKNLPSGEQQLRAQDTPVYDLVLPVLVDTPNALNALIPGFDTFFAVHENDPTMERYQQDPLEILQDVIRQTMAESFTAADELFRITQGSRENFLAQMHDVIKKKLRYHHLPLKVSVLLLGEAGLVGRFFGSFWDYVAQQGQDHKVNVPTALREIEKKFRERTSWMERLFRDISLRESLGFGIFSVPKKLSQPNRELVAAQEFEEAGIDGRALVKATAIEQRALAIQEALPFVQALMNVVTKHAPHLNHQEKMKLLLDAIHQPKFAVWDEAFRSVYDDEFEAKMKKNKFSDISTTGQLDYAKLKAAKIAEIESKMMDKDYRSGLMVALKKTPEGMDIIDPSKTATVVVSIDGVVERSIQYFDTDGKPRKLGEFYLEVNAMHKELRTLVDSMLAGDNSALRTEEVFLQLVKFRKIDMALRQQLLNDPNKNQILRSPKKLTEFIRQATGNNNTRYLEMMTKRFQAMAAADFSVVQRTLPLTGNHGGELTANLGTGQGDICFDYADVKDGAFSLFEMSSYFKKLLEGKDALDKQIAPTRLTLSANHLLVDGANMQSTMSSFHQKLFGRIRELRGTREDQSALQDLTNVVDKPSALLGQKILAPTAQEVMSAEEKKVFVPKEVTAEFELPGKLIDSPKPLNQDVRLGILHTYQQMLHIQAEEFKESVETANLLFLENKVKEMISLWFSRQLNNAVETAKKASWEEYVRSKEYKAKGYWTAEEIAAKKQELADAAKEKAMAHLLAEREKVNAYLAQQTRALFPLHEQIGKIRQEEIAARSRVEEKHKLSFTQTWKARIRAAFTGDRSGFINAEREQELAALAAHYKQLLDPLRQQWVDLANVQLKNWHQSFVEHLFGDIKAEVTDPNFPHFLRFFTTDDKADKVRAEENQLVMGKVTTMAATAYASLTSEAVLRWQRRFRPLTKNRIPVSTLRTVVSQSDNVKPGRVETADLAMSETVGSAFKNLIIETNKSSIDPEKLRRAWEVHLLESFRVKALVYPLQVYKARNNASNATLVTLASGPVRERLLKETARATFEEAAEVYEPSKMDSATHVDTDKGDNDGLFTVPVPTGVLRNAIGYAYDHAKGKEKMTMNMRLVIKEDELDQIAKQHGFYSFKKIQRFGFAAPSFDQQQEILDQYIALRKSEAVELWKAQVLTHTLDKITKKSEMLYFMQQWQGFDQKVRQKFGNTFINYLTTTIAANYGLDSEQILKYTGLPYLDFSQVQPN